MRATSCSGGSDFPPACCRGARHAVIGTGFAIPDPGIVAHFFPVRHTQPVGANKVGRALAILAVHPLLGPDRRRAILSPARRLGFGRRIGRRRDRGRRRGRRTAAWSTARHTLDLPPNLVLCAPLVIGVFVWLPLSAAARLQSRPSWNSFWTVGSWSLDGSLLTLRWCFDGVGGYPR